MESTDGDDDVIEVLDGAKGVPGGCKSLDRGNGENNTVEDLVKEKVMALGLSLGLEGLSLG